jgi:hypothetical protein
MEFTPKNIEVFHRRNKIQDRCKNYQDYDSVLTDTMMQKIGCIPPYWKSSLDVKKCTTRKQIRRLSKEASKAFIGNLDITKYTMKPCLDLRKLTFDFEEKETDIETLQWIAPNLKLTKNESIMVIFLNLWDPYFKEIKQVKAIGLENLVGNVGGYVGLFLGLSIIELPIFCLFVYQKLLTLKRGSSSIESIVPIKCEESTELDSTGKCENDIKTLREKFISLEEKVNCLISVHSLGRENL